MKKIIYILLIITITLSIFADNIIFEEEKDTLKRKDITEKEDTYICGLEYEMGFADGKRLASGDGIFFLIGMTVLGVGPAMYYLYKREYIPSEIYYQKKSVEYKLGFNMGYNKEKTKKNERFLMFGFFTPIFIIPILMLLII